jgi:hypothetical protein
VKLGGFSENTLSNNIYMIIVLQEELKKKSQEALSGSM